MVIADVSIVLFGLSYLANMATRVSLWGLTISFWTDLSLVVIFLLLTAFTWRAGDVSYFVSVLVCLASSLCLTGAAGLAVLPSPWKYFSLLPLLTGATLFVIWLRTFRPLTT